MKSLRYILPVTLLCSSICLCHNVSAAAAEQHQKAKHFCVYMNGRVSRYTSNQNKVGDALKEKGITFRKNQMFPRDNATLIDGTKIFLLKQGEKFEFREISVSEIPVEYVDEPTLEYGAKNILQSGLPGIDKVILKIDANGVQKEIGRIHKVAPRKSIIQRGTKDCVMTEEGLKHYKRKFIGNVSAYTIEDGNGDGITSIGIVPYEGVVAVDPSFIPYHSKLFIPGYGLAVAADTGGAIEGNCIDLFMYDRDRAWQWGRRFIEVYILDD